MQLEGIHHITAITGDAPRNVDFYARVLGLRMVKKTVNQDDPSVYHLFYADEHGSGGADLTFFEYPGADPRPARPGHGAPHRLARRLGRVARLLGRPARRRGRLDASAPATASPFADPEGMAHELVVVDRPDRAARSRGTARSRRSTRCRASRRCAPPACGPTRRRRVLEEALEFTSVGDSVWEARGEERGGRYALDPLPEGRGVPGAGTVHHVAFASTLRGPRGAGASASARSACNPTPVIDRFYFRSIYFREPGGVLFEIATLGPGFTSDEPLRLARRAPLAAARPSSTCASASSRSLTPLPDIRAWRPDAT